MNSKPSYRVATAGLDQRDVRLIDIVFRHSQYNRVSYSLVPVSEHNLVDILIVNPFEPDGLRTLSRVRARGAQTPLVTAVPAGMQSSAQHAIHIERLTLQLLPILNRLVEQEFEQAEAPKVFHGPASKSVSAESADGSGAQDTSDKAASLEGASTIISSTFVDSMFASTLADVHASRLRAANEGSSEFGPTVRSVPVPPVSILAQELLAAGDQERSAKSSPIDAGGSTRGASQNNLVPFPNTGESAAKPISVLVVDDSPTVRRQMSLALNRMGLHCVAVSNAATALAKMRDSHFELAMVDVVMSDMDGYRLTREIRRLHKGTPVIILTSRSSPFDLARGALAGCSNYLVKPVPLKKIESVVMRQLRKSLAIDDLHGLIKVTAPGRKGAGTGSSSASLSAATTRATAGAKRATPRR